MRKGNTTDLSGMEHVKWNFVPCHISHLMHNSIKILGKRHEILTEVKTQKLLLSNLFFFLKLALPFHIWST